MTRVKKLAIRALSREKSTSNVRCRSIENRNKQTTSTCVDNNDCHRHVDKSSRDTLSYWFRSRAKLSFANICEESTTLEERFIVEQSTNNERSFDNFLWLARVEHCFDWRAKSVEEMKHQVSCYEYARIRCDSWILMIAICQFWHRLTRKHLNLSSIFNRTCEACWYRFLHDKRICETNNVNHRKKEWNLCDDFLSIVELCEHVLIRKIKSCEMWCDANRRVWHLNVIAKSRRSIVRNFV